MTASQLYFDILLAVSLTSRNTAQSAEIENNEKKQSQSDAGDVVSRE
jgi:hypothetical protein